MFAKVFEQIYDSSIAEDYNCRRMFMDLLVLSDPTGAVDMTLEAISRRTNVPFNEVSKYVAQLCQPDSKSRSKLEEGKRLVPLDAHRDWGWKIVNYQHYRKLKDEEARRSYFRTAQREYRKKKKNKEEVEEGVNSRKTLSNGVKQSSKTSDAVWLSELSNDPTYAGIDVRHEYGKMHAWCKTNRRQPTRRRFVNWLNRVDRPMTLSQSAKQIYGNNRLPPINDKLTEEQLAAKRAEVRELSAKLRDELKK